MSDTAREDAERTIRVALDLGLQAWRTTSSRDRFLEAFDALAALSVPPAPPETPEYVQRSLASCSDGDLTKLLADVSIAVALRRDVPPHQVLREAVNAYGWPESEWPKVREHVKGWLAAVPPAPDERCPIDGGSICPEDFPACKCRDEEMLPVVPLVDSEEKPPMKFGQGLPPAGGWKRHMVEDPDYSPEYQDEYQRLWHEAAAALRDRDAELERLRAEVAKFLSSQYPAGTDHEADEDADRLRVAALGGGSV